MSTSIIQNSIKINKSNLSSILQFSRKSGISTIEIVLSEKEKTLSLLQNDIGFKQRAKNFNIFLHAYDLELVNLASQSQKINYILSLCSTYDIHRLIIHPGFNSFGLNQVDKHQFFNSAKKLDIMILIENGYKNNELFRSVGEQINCIKKIRDIGATNVFAALDVWRAFKANSNTEQIVYSIKTLLEFNLLKHIHFSDGTRLLNTSVALGDGEIGIDLLLNALNDFQDYVILEVDNLEDAIKSINYLKQRNIL